MLLMKNLIFEVPIIQKRDMVMKFGPHNDRRVLMLRRIDDERRIVDYLERSGLVVFQRRTFDRRRMIRRNRHMDRRIQAV